MYYVTILMPIPGLLETLHKIMNVKWFRIKCGIIHKTEVLLYTLSAVTQEQVGCEWGNIDSRDFQGCHVVSTKLTVDTRMSTRLERWINLEKFVFLSGTICREILLLCLGQVMPFTTSNSSKWVIYMGGPDGSMLKRKLIFPDFTNSERVQGKVMLFMEYMLPLWKAARCS